MQRTRVDRLGGHSTARLIAAALLSTVMAGCGGGGSSSSASAPQAMTILHAFNTTAGYGPSSGVVSDGQGNLYGTTAIGGSGAVYKIDASGVATTLHSFDGSDGLTPTTLLRGSDGNLYGTTQSGGAYGDGTVFKITPQGALTTLHSFSGPDGFLPSVLIWGTDGNLYGTTFVGGATFTSNTDATLTGAGTIFKLTTSGELTTLYSFKGVDGYSPISMVQGTDGAFYGATVFGGPAYVSSTPSEQGAGTVFKLTADGTLTTLFAFGGTTSPSPTALIQGADGNLYGTTYGGGGSLSAALGTVFQVTLNGGFTTLYSFSGTDGMYPDGINQGADGNLYGTTGQGGPTYNSNGNELGYGTIFKITPAGAFTSVFSFAESNGATPQGSLLQGSDGAFYGTTSQAGPSGGGTVFKLSLPAD
jgi:uncharacterized repeat protein (TIGR03803 family)